MDEVNQCVGVVRDDVGRAQALLDGWNDDLSLEQAKEILEAVGTLRATMNAEGLAALELAIKSLSNDVAVAQENEAAAMEAQARESAMREAAVTRADALIESNQDRLSELLSGIDAQLESASDVGIEEFAEPITALRQRSSDAAAALSDAVGL